MKNKSLQFVIALCFIGINTIAQELYKAPSSQTKTVWMSPENPTGAKGSAGMTNKGAKGRAFITLEAGKKIDVLNATGSGIIRRMWLSGTIPRSAEQMQHVRIEMYWDGSNTPAVSAPIGDFFGLGLGKSKPIKMICFQIQKVAHLILTYPCHLKNRLKLYW
jgi:hypothetical protein